MSALILIVIGFLCIHTSEQLKTNDVKDKRGAISGTYSSPPVYGSPDHSAPSSGFSPVSSSANVYPQTTAPISAYLIPGNLVYGQGLDYSGLAYGSYGGAYNGVPSVPPSYSLGLNLAPVSSGSIGSYKLGPVTFNPNSASPYVTTSAYPYNVIPQVAPEYPVNSAYTVPSYPPSGLSYSPSYGSSASSYPSYSSPASSYPSYSSSGSSYPSYSSSASSYPSYSSSASNYPSYSSSGSNYPSYSSSGSSYSSYSSPGLSSYSSSPSHSSSGYSTSPPYSAFTGSSGSSYSSYSSPSSSSYSSPYAQSPVYGAPSYKSGSSLYSKY